MTPLTDQDLARLERQGRLYSRLVIVIITAWVISICALAMQIWPLI